MSQEVVLKGLPASAGKAKGKVHIVTDIMVPGKMREGEVLVTKFSSPIITPLILKASAMVTDEGGVMSHGAIVAREMGVPCVTATKKATQVLRESMEVIVDGDRGYVLKG